VAQMVQCLTSKHQVLNSNPVLPKIVSDGLSCSFLGFWFVCLFVCFLVFCLLLLGFSVCVCVSVILGMGPLSMLEKCCTSEQHLKPIASFLNISRRRRRRKICLHNHKAIINSNKTNQFLYHLRSSQDSNSPNCLTNKLSQLFELDSRQSTSIRSGLEFSLFLVANSKLPK
jgi:hypothetical protein